MSVWKWWIAIAGTALVVGGVAWILKLWVIVATDGRVQYTGAAGAFFTLGLYSLLVGSTGLGLRLAMNQESAIRVCAMSLLPRSEILRTPYPGSCIEYCFKAAGSLLGASTPGDGLLHFVVLDRYVGIVNVLHCHGVENGNGTRISPAWGFAPTAKRH